MGIIILFTLYSCYEGWTAGEHVCKLEVVMVVVIAVMGVVGMED